MSRRSMILAPLMLFSAANATVPFWGDKVSMPVDTAPAALKEGTSCGIPRLRPAVRSWS